MPIRMNMCHDTQNPAGQVRGDYPQDLPRLSDRPSHKGYPEEKQRIEDFYDQWVFNQFFRTSEYDR